MKVAQAYVILVGDSDSTTGIPLGCVKSNLQIKSTEAYVIRVGDGDSTAGMPLR